MGLSELKTKMSQASDLRLLGGPPEGSWETQVCWKVHDNTLSWPYVAGQSHLSGECSEHRVGRVRKWKGMVERLRWGTKPYKKAMAVCKVLEYLVEVTCMLSRSSKKTCNLYLSGEQSV